MKIYDEKTGFMLRFEDEPIILTIENTNVFFEFVQSLWQQSHGGEGRLFLSDQEKEMNFSKAIEVIINPFQVSLNDRKIINHLYKELNEIATEHCVESTMAMNQHMIEYMDDLIEKIHYPLVYNENLDVLGLFKYVKLGFEEETDFLEKLVSYLKAVHQVCGISCVICVGLKMYLTEEQLALFYQMLAYEKIFFLDVENRFFSALKQEKNFILDQDLCIIEI